MSSYLMTPMVMKNTTAKNRFVRSATYEGMADSDGRPRPELGELYARLARGGVGTIITGFVFVSQAGRAMQSGQCGIDTDSKTDEWRKIIEMVRRDDSDVKLFMQLAHAGRQTTRAATGGPVLGASSRKCTYFRQPVSALKTDEVEGVAREFADAARRAKAAGFDGVQVHAAHGYLVHQFLSPHTNLRTDQWADRPAFLERVIGSIKESCGSDYPVMMKLSWAEDSSPGIRLADTVETVKRVEPLGVDAVEISYGTMELGLNIIRGEVPVDTFMRTNPMFAGMPVIPRKAWKRLFLTSYLRRIEPFEENYNVDAAVHVAEETSAPVFAVGGIRSVEAMSQCIERGLVGVSLCRPLICEPDLPREIEQGRTKKARCSSCNLCTAHCDTDRALRCYRFGKEDSHDNSNHG